LSYTGLSSSKIITKGTIHMDTMQHITPLPRRVQPLSWEDFGSFLVRTAKHMGYQTPHWILKPETSSYHIDIWKLSALSRQADYDFLSQLLLVPETRLYQMTTHRFSPLLEQHSDEGEKASIQLRQQRHLNTPYQWRSINRQLLYRNLGGFFLSNSLNIRICPLCAQSPEAYDRIYWRIRPLLTCPIHDVLLQTSCPVCLKKWPSLRFSGAYCPSCLQPIHQDPKDLQKQKHPAFFYILQGDSLLLQMFGYEQGPSDRIAVSRAQDLRAFLPAEEFLRLFHVYCTKISPLSKEALSTFLPPSFYELLTLLENTTDSIQMKKRAVHSAIIHWLFLGGEAHYFAFLDTLNFLQRETHPVALFRNIPWGAFAPYTPTFRLLTQLHQRYRSLYEAQGVQALEKRVWQRKKAFEEENKRENTV
jgi:hypothetical protein